MLSAPSQESKLESLIRAASAGLSDARRGTLFCSRRGLALVNAAFDLFECDALYDLGSDVAREIERDEDLRHRRDAA